MTIIGFHFADSGIYDGAHRARWLQQIIRIRPRYAVVIAGSQRGQATEFVREVRRNSPQTSVVIRHYADGGDEGMWTRIEPEDYVKRIGGLYLEQLADLDGWYLMPDNEFASENRTTVDTWQAWMARAAIDAHKVGLRLALGCQPTHNPEPDLIKAGWLDVLFQVFKQYPEHVYYRNVYYSSDNLDGLRYVRDIVERMKLKTGYVPTIVIGELGRLRSITEAQHGYKSIPGITRAALANEAVLMYRTYLQGLSPKGIYACWYCVGDWPIGHDTFNIAEDNAFFDALAAVANEKLPDTAPLPTAPRPPVVPEPEPGPVDIPEPPKPGTNTRHYALERHVNSMRLLVDAHHARRLILQAEMDALDAQAQMLQVELLLAEDALEQWTEAAQAA